jgi:hypothetical protein
LYSRVACLINPLPFLPVPCWVIFIRDGRGVPSEVDDSSKGKGDYALESCLEEGGQGFEKNSETKDAVAD